MAFVKHVGKHNNRKCVILYRQVPNEEHMCLVVYPDILPKHIHDSLMEAVESEVGQNEQEFADYLFRVTMADGNNALQTLHKEGMIKKVPTNQVIVIPNAKSAARLDEINNVLNKMALGEEAVREMADLDANAGMVTKRKTNENAELRTPANSRSVPAQVDSNINISDILTDEQIAQQRLAQSQKMQLEAKQLLVEAERLANEAKEMLGSTNGRTKTKKTKVSQSQS